MGRGRFDSHVFILSYTHSPILTQLSGLNEAIELADLDTQFAVRKSKGQHSSPPIFIILTSSTRTPTESGGGKPKKPAILDSKKAYNICEAQILSHSI